MAAQRPAGSRVANASFEFDRDAVRSGDEPTQTMDRLVWLLLELVRRRPVRYRAYYERFQLDDRTFKRDARRLRILGDRYDFAVTCKQLTLELAAFDGERRVRALDDASAREAARAVAEALGEVVADGLRAIVDLTGFASDGFLRVALPRLIDGEKVAEAYRTLREAWAAHARVRFGYPDRRRSGAIVERDVDPHAVTYVDGRYYLVAFDPRPRGGWRQFALDRIVAPIARVGTFAPRRIPEPYRGEDAVGLFKRDGVVTPTDVTIELAADIADAVFARRWQRDARAIRRTDGTAAIVLSVYDLGEAVRWAFAFGDRARITSPSEAVALARAQLEAMLAASESLADSPRPAASAPLRSA
jgi:predicted DNA-binding transcriptional regulator YafY